MLKGKYLHLISVNYRVKKYDSRAVLTYVHSSLVQNTIMQTLVKWRGSSCLFVNSVGLD